ncbi:hypothetical protein QTO17_01240 [Vibrio owensii]
MIDEKPLGGFGKVSSRHWSDFTTSNWPRRQMKANWLFFRESKF